MKAGVAVQRETSTIGKYGMGPRVRPMHHLPDFSLRNGQHNPVLEWEGRVSYSVSRTNLGLKVAQGSRNHFPLCRGELQQLQKGYLDLCHLKRWHISEQPRAAPGHPGLG